MDIIIGSSRAKYLGQDNKTLNVSTWYKSGGKIKDMYELVDQHLFYNPISNSEKTHMYIVCGICDITQIKKDYCKHYREIIYNYDPDTNIIRMKDDFNSLTNYIKYKII